MNGFLGYFKAGYIIFYASQRFDTTLLIVLYWLGSYYVFSAQGWVTKKIAQIIVSLQSQLEA